MNSPWPGRVASSTARADSREPRWSVRGRRAGSPTGTRSARAPRRSPPAHSPRSRRRRGRSRAASPDRPPRRTARARRVEDSSFARSSRRATVGGRRCRSCRAVVWSGASGTLVVTHRAPNVSANRASAPNNTRRADGQPPTAATADGNTCTAGGQVTRSPDTSTRTRPTSSSAFDTASAPARSTAATTHPITRARTFGVAANQLDGQAEIRRHRAPPRRRDVRCEDATPRNRRSTVRRLADSSARSRPPAARTPQREPRRPRRA